MKGLVGLSYIHPDQPEFVNGVVDGKTVQEQGVAGKATSTMYAYRPKW